MIPSTIGLLLQGLARARWASPILEKAFPLCESLRQSQEAAKMLFAWQASTLTWSPQQPTLPAAPRRHEPSLFFCAFALRSGSCTLTHISSSCAYAKVNVMSNTLRRCTPLLVVFAACRSPLPTFCSDDHCYGPVFVFSNTNEFSQTPRRIADVISHGGAGRAGGLGGGFACSDRCPMQNLLTLRSFLLLFAAARCGAEVGHMLGLK